jgi:hypothetical protein
MGYAQIIFKLPLWMRHAIMREAISRGECMTLKLSELEPRFAADKDGRRWITFDCPKCRDHKIAVQIAGEGKFVWQISGTIADDNITITPSIAWAPKSPDGIASIVAECDFHFFVKRGEIEPLHGNTGCLRVDCEGCLSTSCKL